ncbi:MAG: cob(I)yrinic acid a,c-diamide adenosyltransferase [Armatimonadota bacterium]
MSKGYVQVYTGNGKGKTTAALGLAMRAAGAGMRVFIGQFVKGMDYSELHSFAKLSDQITLKQFGRRCFIRNEPEMDDVLVARQGLDEVRRAVASGEYGLVIMDEANIATYYNLFSVDELLEIIDTKPEHVELVITGRYVDDRIVERADLVTEMREVKHYYTQGVLARAGIES